MVGSLFSELKRRNVFKVATGYLLLGWLVLQIADVVVPILELPEWTLKLILFLGIFGLPFALFFAWAFELTPDGIKKDSDLSTEELTSTRSNQTLNIIISLLVIALGYFIYESRFTSTSSQNPVSTQVASDKSANEVSKDSETTRAQEGISIAVLPFVNMSSDVEQEYFSDGISEELLNLLAKIPNLQVAARTSSFQFKGKNQDIQNIAKQLGVKTILEGSIRKSGTKVRITAQLIKADDGFHMWSDTYDRELTDIFKVQDEISAAIVGSLKETLGIELVSQSHQTKAISPEAYDLYLHGLQDLYIYTFDSLTRSVNAFESAIKLEPDFLLAKVKLAETYQFQIQTGSRFDREILDKADSILEDVISASPDMAQAYYVRSLIASKKRRTLLADQYIKEAYRLDPNQVDIITEYARRLGFQLGEEKTRALFNRAMKYDPLNFRVNYGLYNYLTYTLQQYDQAESVLKAVNPMTTDSLYAASFTGLYRNIGNMVKALEYNIIASSYDPLDPEGPLYGSFIYLCLGDGVQAVKSAELAVELNPLLGDAITAKVDALIHIGKEEQALMLATDSLDNPEYLYRRTTKAYLVSKVIYLLLKNNQLDTAEKLFTKHLPEIVALVDAPEPKTAEQVGDWLGITLLTTIYTVQGKLDKARVLAKRLTLLDESFYTQKQVHLMPVQHLLLAANSAAQNNDELALQYFESLPNGNFPDWWRARVIHSPIFHRLKNNPRFITLHNRFELEMKKQRKLLNAK